MSGSGRDEIDRSCLGFLDARQARIVCVTPQAGVRESSKSDPRDGGEAYGDLSCELVQS